MICAGRCSAVAKGIRAFSRPIYNIGHITVHSLPSNGTPSAIAGLALVLGVFLLANSTATKVTTLLAALIYSFIEFTFTKLYEGRAFTSLAQFLVNLFYIPIAIDGYYALFFSTELGVIAPRVSPYSAALLFVLLFPINIWVLELVESALISFIWGRNVAWCYCSSAEEDPLARLSGGVLRLQHGPFWLLMGFAVLVMWPAKQQLENYF